MAQGCVGNWCLAAPSTPAGTRPTPSLPREERRNRRDESFWFNLHRLRVQVSVHTATSKLNNAKPTSLAARTDRNQRFIDPPDYAVVGRPRTTSPILAPE